MAKGPLNSPGRKILITGILALMVLFNFTLPLFLTFLIILALLYPRLTTASFHKALHTYRSVRKKKEYRRVLQKAKKTFYWIWGILSVLLLLFLLVVTTIAVYPWAKDYYLYTLNPKAGVLALEGQYQKAFSDEDTAYIASIQTLSKLLSQDATTKALTQDELSIQNNFSKCTTDYQTMLALDKKAASLSLPFSYKHFFQKREVADQANSASFTTTSTRIQKLMDMVYAVTSYQESYAAVGRKMFTSAQQGSFRKQDLAEVTALYGALQTDYINIQAISNDASFTTDLGSYLQNEYDMIGVAQKAFVAAAQNDSASYNAYGHELQALAANNPTNGYEVIQSWENSILVPIFVKSIGEYNTFLTMYNQAYSYAQKMQLNDILSVWKGDTPGNIPARTNLNISSQVS